MFAKITNKFISKELHKLYTKSLIIVSKNTFCNTLNLDCKITKILHQNVFSNTLNVNSRRQKSRNVLGIETSCDDTGAAIINEDGVLLAEQLNSQTAYHVE